MLFLLCFFINFLDDASWNTSYNDIFRNILSNDSSAATTEPLPIRPFDSNSIGTDKNVIPRRYELDLLKPVQSHQQGPHPHHDVAVFTNSSTTTKDSPHINHSTSTDFSTDVDNSPIITTALSSIVTWSRIIAPGSIRALR